MRSRAIGSSAQRALTSEPARYRLRPLDMRRAYALGKLSESGVIERVRALHAQYYRDLFERAEAEWEARPGRMAG